MLEEFAASRRAEATRKGYPKMMRLLVPDPDALLTKAKTDRRTAEDCHAQRGCLDPEIILRLRGGSVQLEAGPLGSPSGEDRGQGQGPDSGGGKGGPEARLPQGKDGDPDHGLRGPQDWRPPGPKAEGCRVPRNAKSHRGGGD